MRKYRLQNLKTLYLLALAIIALAFIASALLMQYASNRNQEDLRIVSLSGRQCSLCQRLTKAVLVLGQQSDKAGQQKALTEISESLAAWKATHQGLQFGNAKLGLPFRANSPQVAGLFEEVQPLHSAMTHALEQLLAQLKEEPDSPEAVTRAADLMMKLEPRFVELMEQITAHFEKEAWKRLALVQDLGQGILFVGLLVVLLEFLLVFRPSIGNLTELMDSLKSQTLEIQQANDCLQEALEKSIAVEKALRDSEKRYAQLAEQSGTVAWEVDPNGLFTYSSAVAEKVLGYRPDELVGRIHLFELHPETGSEEFRAHLFGAFENRDTLKNLIHPVVAKDGRLAWVSTNAAPLMGADGALVGYRGSDTDITERKAMEDHLMRTQRMESIGTLAAGIAHDLNNILTPIILSSGLLRGVDEPESRDFLIQSIERCATRGSEVVGQVLTFARGVGGERTALFIQALVEDVHKIAKETFPRNIEIKTSLPHDIWPVCANATQLHQVLLNLCINARDAMPEGGSLLITGENKRVDENAAAMMPDAAPGDYAVIEVRDSGTGIPREIIGKIFDPFFTTKEVHKGTGLGLSTVIGIVRSYGGFVTVQSTEGQGAAFRVHLPRDRGEVGAHPSESGSALPQGNGETILVIDDEVSVAETISKVLVKNGHNVLTAQGGEDALALYQEHGSRIDLVLTDLMMPGMDGVALSKALKAINPKVKILASTGQASELHQGELNELGIYTILSKPYDAKTLLTTLAAAIRT